MSGQQDANALTDIRGFHPSRHSVVPLLPPPPIPLTSAAPETYEEVIARLARCVGDAGELFRTQRPGTNNVKGLDSLYVGPSGRSFLFHEHIHDETARTVLRAVCGGQAGIIADPDE